MEQNGQDNKFWKSWLGISLVCSMIFHGLFYLSRFSPFSTNETSIEDNRPIEITEIPTESLPPPPVTTRPAEKAKPVPPSKKEKEIAETEDAKNREEDPEARFLSDRTQKAELQTKAKLVDDFRKTEGDGPKGKVKGIEAPPTATETVAEKEQEQSFTDLEVSDTQALAPDSKKGVQRDWKKMTLTDLGLGGEGGNLGASDDRLKGVDDGDRTILSTREFKFFSYYHRIKELLRQHWKPNVERRLTRMYEKGRTVGENEMVTRLQVLLSPEGRISKISRVTSSGIEEIDEAAIEAFNRASPFPNPPRGMLDADGFVRINWDFILKTEAAPRIQFSNAGRPMP